ncbi:alpha-L-rhamnosidase [Konateibacter massiliensis]|uniref:alpha-L-rhamnosidase n=1 Tax=Konateibacter massiliensis TaxID=2002841 RepID=UPI000C157735|nr:alpha-L-rhamnosidase [Konateibacter massiliensis]
MKITNLQINGITNPVGFHYEYLVCSWNVTDTESKKQKKARIEVSDSDSFVQILFQKEGEDLKQGGEAIEMGIKPRTTYYYRVSVWGDGGDSAVSETCFFETGKMSEEWNAEWIAAPKQEEIHPVLKKSFFVEKPVKRARLYASCVGLFEAYLNGKKLGEEYLAPYINHYETNIQVMTFPMEEELLTGEDNDIKILLGKGWYMAAFGLELKKENYGDRMAAIGELYLEYKDGTTECICTDDTWSYCGSDIEDSGIYDGEIQNRLLWSDKDNKEKPVEVLWQPERSDGTKNLAKHHLMDRLSLPVLAKESMEVKEIITTPAGETVLDMGQNFAGFMEFTVDLPKNTRVILSFGEILQQGNFYNKNYRDAKSQFVYISGGEKEVVRPHFTFFGFRYVRVEGWVGELKKEDFTGWALYSDIQRTGYLETANQKVNRLYENTLWGLKSNFLDMPTDCPQRSERLGWTGDAQVFAPTASYHMDTRAFFHKFLKDLRDEQRLLDGGIPNFLPNIGHKKDASSVWGDIATLLPNTLFTYYNSVEEMEYCYPIMKDWVDYIDRQDAARGRQYLYNTGFTFGDWLALDGPTPTSFKGSTDDAYISSVYYYRSVQLVRETAEKLQKTEDAAHYGELESKIKEAIFHEFFTPSGRLAIDTQAAYIIALKFGIYHDKEELKEQFKRRLQSDCNQIKCGFVGAPLLCTVLGEIGEYELAYDFLLKEDFPSWLYSVNLGATTIWERWNSVAEDGTISDTGMNSLNHYAYGSVMEFAYAYLAGIRPLEKGFQKAVIAPKPDIRLPYVKGSYNSAWGTYVCNWSIQKEGNICIHIEIPFACEAVVELPEYGGETKHLSGGSYDFDYMPKRDFRKPYHEKTTLSRLSNDEKAMGILFRYVPAIGGIAASKEPEMGAKTLEQITHMEYLPFEPDKLKKAIEELCALQKTEDADER